MTAVLVSSDKFGRTPATPLGSLLRYYLRLARYPKGVDARFYLTAYPDVAAARMSASDHYWNHGWREGRNPSRDFHSLYYASRYMAGGELASNPLAHYARLRRESSGEIATVAYDRDEWKAAQKAKVALDFDADFYKLKYAPLLQGLDPLDHYFDIGWRNACNPTEDFDSKQYLEKNKYILASDVNPFYHHIVVGKRRDFERRRDTADVSVSRRSAAASKRAEIIAVLAPHFDEAHYYRENRDVAAAGMGALEHYVDYGAQEGRNPTSIFWTNYYRDRYPDVAVSGQNPFFHYLTYGKAHGYDPNPMGHLTWPRPRAPDDLDWARLEPAIAKGLADVCVIVPVYKGYDDTLATIHSVLANRQKTNFTLIVVNDCSPDAALTEKLHELARRGLFIYVENEINLGFVQTANKALAIAAPADVVLLNADTLVFGDWLDRLRRQAEAEPVAATITPFSNNATICSYPNFNGNNTLALECSLEELDAYASICNQGRSVRLPTGVGFCLYMRRSALDELGSFDLIFGRGYGEECDFCMRALKAGYKNLLAADVFVYHSGKVSFGDPKVTSQEPGLRELNAKHPDYARRVQSFISADSVREARARLDLYRVARNCGPRAAVFLTIDSAGGIDTHVNNLSGRLLDAGVSVLLLHLEGDEVTIKPFSRSKEIYTPSLAPINICGNLALLREFLEWLDPEIVHVHSFAKLKWRSTQMMMEMLTELSTPFYATLHDYDSICHRHHLVDREGRYCSPVKLSDCRTCVRTDGQAVDRVDPVVRQTTWRNFLQKAKQVFVPSEDARRRLESRLEGVTLSVREHEESFPPREFLTLERRATPLKVVAIGAIGPHKGCDVLFALAQDVMLRNLPIQYSIVGYSAITDRLKEVGVIETGRYASAQQCMEHVERIAPHFALLPSIWPETHCFTLSIAMALGLPPIVFDLGAQADRVSEAGFGVVMDRALTLSPAALNDAILRLSVEDEWAKRRKPEFKRYQVFPEEYYAGRSLRVLEARAA
ncbi:MAG TPA: glycosyltransferase [Methylocystis sp.]|nr:glycosyltransferase [Methylocystis sp.]